MFTWTRATRLKDDWNKNGSSKHVNPKILNFACSWIIPSVHVNTSTDVQGEMIHYPPLQQLVVLLEVTNMREGRD